MWSSCYKAVGKNRLYDTQILDWNCRVGHNVQGAAQPALMKQQWAPLLLLLKSAAIVSKFQQLSRPFHNSTSFQPRLNKPLCRQFQIKLSELEIAEYMELSNLKCFIDKNRLILNSENYHFIQKRIPEEPFKFKYFHWW